eukprot:2793720-Pyramimonas_sp.AAC.1
MTRLEAEAGGERRPRSRTSRPRSRRSSSGLGASATELKAVMYSRCAGNSPASALLRPRGESVTRV